MRVEERKWGQIPGKAAPCLPERHESLHKCGILLPQMPPNTDATAVKFQCVFWKGQTVFEP